QRDVVTSLQYVWSLLKEPLKQRFLDLAISPRDRSIHVAVFQEFWAVVPRSDTPFDAHEEESPLAAFSKLSLLQAGSNKTYILHDLYRIMIERQIQEDGLRSRHRDLLDAFGFVGSDGQFALDEEQRFRIDHEDRRTKLVPALRQDVAQEDKE